MDNNNKTRVVMQNTISLDGSFVNFDMSPEVMGLHYQIVGSFGKILYLFGSNTAKVAIEMFGGLTPETKDNFKRPQKSEDLSYWVVVDSEAVLKGKLHFYRRSEYCRDIIVLVSESTDKSYLDYLKEREYDFVVAGEKQIDLKKSFDVLSDRYETNTVLVDSGRGLTNAMLNQGLVDEISLLVLPVIVGEKSENLFSNITKQVKLTELKEETFPGGYVHLHYKIDK
jgi:2,5-diamino-6-(ribosylamino)-4(3H)-pyrimidinone 5'-phosphate reductase